MNVLLGVTGSVAATITPKLIELVKVKHSLKVIVTKHSDYFWKTDSWKPTIEILKNTTILKDDDEWPAPDGYQRGDDVLHIELRKWADILVIAPLSANTLAKLANGLSDNLLTSVVRAWDPTKPIILVPAMNTLMWTHPATKEHLEKIHRWFLKTTTINPVSKVLACGDAGIGAMAPIEEVVEAINLYAKV